MVISPAGFGAARPRRLGGGESSSLLSSRMSRARRRLTTRDAP
jgi:hypothetical protein